MSTIDRWSTHVAPGLLVIRLDGAVFGDRSPAFLGARFRWCRNGCQGGYFGCGFGILCPSLHLSVFFLFRLEAVIVLFPFIEYHRYSRMPRITLTYEGQIVKPYNGFQKRPRLGPVITKCIGLKFICVPEGALKEYPHPSESIHQTN